MPINHLQYTGMVLLLLLLDTSGSVPTSLFASLKKRADSEYLSGVEALPDWSVRPRVVSHVYVVCNL